MEPGPSGLPVARKSIRSHENLNVYGGEGKEPEVSQASGDGRAVEHERSDNNEVQGRHGRHSQNRIVPTDDVAVDGKVDVLDTTEGGLQGGFPDNKRMSKKRGSSKSMRTPRSRKSSCASLQSDRSAAKEDHDAETSGREKELPEAAHHSRHPHQHAEAGMPSHILNRDKVSTAVTVKHRTPSVERLHDTPHISVLIPPVPRRDVVYTAYGGPGRKKRIKRTWRDVDAHARKKPQVSATVAPVLTANAAALEVTPAAAGLQTLHTTPVAGAAVGTGDINDVALFFGYLTGKEFLDHVHHEYPCLSVEEVHDVGARLVHAIHMYKEHAQHPLLKDIVPSAVGDVVIADWAKRSKVPLGHYQRAFADAHDLCSLNEVRRVHAYVAKGYYLPNAITATLMERTGLEFVVYRDVFWLEVTTVTKPSLLRAVIGAVVLAAVLAQGLAFTVAVLAGANPMELNPDIPHPVDPEVRYTERETYEQYWDWLSQWPRDGYQLQTFRYLRLCRMIGVIWIVEGLLDTFFNVISDEGSKRMMNRGLLDTYTNRLIRFFHPFTCWNFAVNLFALGFYADAGNVGSDPAGARALCALSVIFTYLLSSPYLLMDPETRPATMFGLLQVYLLDVFMNWTEILRCLAVLVLFILLTPIHIIYIVVAGIRIVADCVIGDVEETISGEDRNCCSDPGCVAYVLGLWTNAMIKLAEDHIM